MQSHLIIPPATHSVDAEAPRRSRWFTNNGNAAVALYGLAIVLLVVRLCINPTMANDLFWQLRAGHEIVRNHQIPYYDTFSWSRYGSRWVAHEWLMYVVLWECYRLGHGFIGILILEITLCSLCMLSVFSITRQENGGNPLTAFILTVAAAILSYGFFQPRPQLVTYLFLTITVGIALRTQRTGKLNGPWWLILPFFVLWSNLHAGVIIGVAVFGLFGIGAALEAVYADDVFERSEFRRQAISLLSLAGLTFLMTFLNPYGWRIYEDFLATISNPAAMNGVAEWQPTNMRGPFGKSLEIVFLIVLAGLLFSQERRRLGELMLILAFAHISLLYLRNVPLFPIIALEVSARHLDSMLRHIWKSVFGMELTTQMSRRGLAGAVTFCWILPFALIIIGSMGAWRMLAAASRGQIRKGEAVARYTIAFDVFPEKACRFIDAERFPNSMRMFNSYGFGGYLIWREPHHPVFIDGRADVYFGDVLNNDFALNQGVRTWRTPVNHYGFDLAVLPASDPASSLFLNAPDWVLVYADFPVLDGLNHLIFVRRIPQYRDLIARCRHDCPAIHSGQLLKNYVSYKEYAALRG